MTETAGHAPALPAADCETCSTAGTKTGFRWCDRYWEHLALSQGDQITTTETMYRAVLRERDVAKADAEAAHDLAEQYAGKAGVDITPDSVLAYAADYWRMRGDWDRGYQQLGTFRMDILALHRQLTQGVPGDTPAADLATRVVKYIADANPVGSPRRNPGELFPRPALPDGTGGAS